MTGPQAEGGEDTRQHEIVIIRRRGGGDDAPHKGGVWKIAHADFMTALMCFFLVMWLITATDEKTVTGVANYFNPMRLTDQSAKPKGVFNMDPGADHEVDEHGPSAPAKHSKTGKPSEKMKDAEAAMLSDPYTALDKLAAEAGKNPAGQHGGDAFRDPFDPDMRYVPGRGETGEPNVRQDDIARREAAPAAPGTPDARGNEDGTPEDLKRKIEEAISQSGFAAIPGIDVRATGEGVMISITDQPDFEMFGIASARPKGELVVLMGQIGKIIGGRPERIVISGHTDGRPYRAGGYDNWRLSTARAHMAQYMLVRSGVSQERIVRIEGHADHDLEIKDDPLAAANRRIEVLLVKGGR